MVVLYFVLEHLRDPLALLQEIGRILKPGGLLSVAVPNIAGLYFRLNKQAWIAERVRHQSHFYEFSPRTLRRILARAGLRAVALTSEGRYTRGHAAGYLGQTATLRQCVAGTSGEGLMRLGALQPGYLPWLGFFDQIARCDVFILYDDLPYTKDSWRNRNRIQHPTGMVLDDRPSGQ